MWYLLCIFIYYTSNFKIQLPEYTKEALSELDNIKGSAEYNKNMWNNYDWSQKGEEWNKTAKKERGLDPVSWKKDLINKMIFKYIKKDSTVLEIGPGAGRWTVELVQLASKLILGDISENCLSMCRTEFRNFSNVEYNLITNGLDFLEADSLDYIWSYDVFLHINPSIVYDYMKDFKRVLKPGGIGIIQHPGDISLYKNKSHRRVDSRSNFDQHIMMALIRQNNLVLLEQNFDISGKPGDVVTVFTKK